MEILVPEIVFSLKIYDTPNLPLDNPMLKELKYSNVGLTHEGPNPQGLNTFSIPDIVFFVVYYYCAL